MMHIGRIKQDSEVVEVRLLVRASGILLGYPFILSKYKYYGSRQCLFG